MDTVRTDECLSVGEACSVRLQKDTDTEYVVFSAKVISPARWGAGHPVFRSQVDGVFEAGSQRLRYRFDFELQSRVGDSLGTIPEGRGRLEFLLDPAEPETQAVLDKLSTGEHFFIELLGLACSERIVVPAFPDVEQLEGACQSLMAMSMSL